MKNYFPRASLLIAILFALPCLVRAQLIGNLSRGEKQTFVVYGTSLSAYLGGPAWVKEVADNLNHQFIANQTAKEKAALTRCLYKRIFA